MNKKEKLKYIVSHDGKCDNLLCESSKIDECPLYNICSGLHRSSIIWHSFSERGRYAYKLLNQSCLTQDEMDI